MNALSINFTPTSSTPLVDNPIVFHIQFAAAAVDMSSPVIDVSTGSGNVQTTLATHKANMVRQAVTAVTVLVVAAGLLGRQRCQRA